jgi:chromosomal replication initiation ATPase DnaA
VALIEGWRDWPARKLVLSGPEGAGKTHLAHVWAALSGGRMIAAARLEAADIAALGGRGPVCVEDAERIAGNRTAEEALFHLHNLVLAEGHALLLTARRPPAHWPLALADLRSRLMGSQSVALPEPDDMLLSAVLAKLLDDRGAMPEASVIGYLVKRMPRSFAAARFLADSLDAQSLATRRRIGIRMAAEALARLEAETADGHVITKPSQD